MIDSVYSNSRRLNLLNMKVLGLPIRARTQSIRISKPIITTTATLGIPLLTFTFHQAIWEVVCKNSLVITIVSRPHRWYFSGNQSCRIPIFTMLEILLHFSILWLRCYWLGVC